MSTNPTSENQNLVSDLKFNIEELDSALGFVSAQYTEVANGVLPRLVADFLSSTSDIEALLKKNNSFELTLIIKNREWTFSATIDQITYHIVNLTIFFTLSPRDFYYQTKSNRFNSIKNAVETLYYSDIPEYSKEVLTEASLIELNQVGTTDYKYLNNLLRSINSPSFFAYTKEGLLIKHLPRDKESEITPDFEIDPSSVSYYIENREHSFLNDSLLISLPQISNESSPYPIIEWGGMRVSFNRSSRDLIENLVENSIYQKSLKLNLRLTSQTDLGIAVTNIVKIDLPNLETKLYIVMDKLIIIGSEIKYNYQLTALDLPSA